MQNLVTVNFQLLPHVRKETHNSLEYVIAPVVAVRAGVLNGELLPADEIAKSVAMWNGVPLPISHPKENGKPISVNRADLLAACIGTFQNAHFDGFSLRGELWIDAAKARTQGGDALIALERIEKNEPLEVSTAYEPRPVEPMWGEFYGNAYRGIQRNIRPDHLALLPHERGACSWEHGCGAPRVNQQKEPAMTFLEKLKAKFATAFAEVEAEEPLALPVMTESNSPVLPAAVPQEEPVVVPPLSTNAHQSNCDCSSCAQHVNQEVHMDKKELVSNVLKARGLGEEHREGLTALPEPLLEKLAINAEPTPEASKQEPAPAVSAAAPAAPVVNTDALYMLNQFEAFAQQRRDKVTTQIVANTDYTAEQLARKDIADLDQIARNLIPQANYGGRVFPHVAGNTEKKTGVPKPPPLVPPKEQAAA